MKQDPGFQLVAEKPRKPPPVAKRKPSRYPTPHETKALVDAIPGDPKRFHRLLTAHFLRHHAREDERCARGAIASIDPATSIITIVPLTCKRWLCPHCAPGVARRWIARISAVPIDRFLTLTVDQSRYASPQDAYNAIVENWPKLIRKLRKEKGPLEWLLVFEAHKKGWPHVHVATHGAYIPIRFLRYWWNRMIGGTHHRISKVHDARGCARYIAKYMSKNLADTWEHFLPRRLVLHSRKFFPDDDPPEPDPEEPPRRWKKTELLTSDLIETLVGCHGWTVLEGTTHGSYVLYPPPDYTPSPGIERVLASF